MRTQVGYTGGNTPDPTYYKMGDHTESLLVEYDPSVVTYARLLEVFWESHNPVAPPGSRQYMAAAFYMDSDQRRELRESRMAVAQRMGETVQTLSAAAGRFYPAEDYHQKYYLQNNDALWQLFVDHFGTEQAAIDSTLAARANGAMGGYGDPVALRRELEAAGLPREAIDPITEKLEKSLAVRCQ